MVLSHFYLALIAIKGSNVIFFLFINICWAQRVVLKPESEGVLTAKELSKYKCTREACLIAIIALKHFVA